MTENNSGKRSEETLPAGFCERMQRLLPEEEYQAFLSSYGRKRLFSLRVNPLKCSGERFPVIVRDALADSADRTGHSVPPEEGDTLTDSVDRTGHPASSEEGDASPAAVSAGQTQRGGKTAELSPVPWEPDGFYYPEEFRPGRLPWHEAGMYYIQEASAMAPARLCGARPGERVLDLCAAPGGKSTKLAADLAGRGLLVANEIHPERARTLSSNIERMGIRNALVTNASPQELASRFPLFFDRIVVDAPCSGEGMFRKEEEALLHWSEENVRMCAARQSEILEEAASMLRAGGTLVYSTCTFSPEENEGVIARFLTAHPEFSAVNLFEAPGIEAEEWGFMPGRPEWGTMPAGRDLFSAAETADGASARDGSDGDRSGEESPAPAFLPSLSGTVRLWPHRLEGEGHFAAVLRKAADKYDRPYLYRDQERTAAGKKDGKSRGKASRGKKSRNTDLRREELIRLWRSFLEETLNPEGAEKDPGDTTRGFFAEENLFCFGETLYALPIPSGALSLEGLRVLRPGLQLGAVTKGRFVPAHALGMALHTDEVCRSVDLPGQSGDAYAWLRGETIPLPPDLTGKKGWVLVSIDGCAAGWGKAAGAVLKNHYPKGLRKGSSYRR